MPERPPTSRSRIELTASAGGLVSRMTLALTGVAVAALLIFMLAIVGTVRSSSAAEAPDPAEVAAQGALSRMSAADRASQLIMTSVPGTVLTATDARTVRAARFGGIILFGANYQRRTQLQRFTKALQIAALGGDASRARLLVSVDQEGGVVKRMPDIAPFRSHPQLGASAATGSTRAQARASASTLLSVGVHMNLAPVADLDLGPRRVMRERSFGADPQRVSAHVAAFTQGAHDGGGTVVAKHFPGFGGANVNSDDALAVITRTAAQLRARDLVPFRAALDAGTDGVMISHAKYAALDRRNPASASPAIYRMLREEFGYDGIAMTDSLHAAGFGAAAGTTVATGCVRVVAAGADIALLTETLADALACRRALIAAAARSAKLRARIDESVLRVLRLKHREGLLPAASAST